MTADEALLREVGRVVKDGLGGWAWDGVRLGVGLGSAPVDDVERWDDACAELGLEFVHVEKPGGAGGRNEFGGLMFRGRWGM